MVNNDKKALQIHEIETFIVNSQRTVPMLATSPDSA